MADKANDVPKLKRTDSRYVDPRMPWTQVAFIEELLKSARLHGTNTSATSRSQSKTSKSGELNELRRGKGELLIRKRKLDDDGDGDGVDLGIPARTH